MNLLLLTANLLAWSGIAQAIIANPSSSSNLTTIRITSRRTSTRTVIGTGLPTAITGNTSQPIITAAPWLNNTQPLSGPDLATYHNFTYKTLCSYADLRCYNTCMTAVKACTSEHDIWSTGRKSHQSSWATLYNGGSMPMSYTTYTVSPITSTIYNYSTSYDEYLQATTVPAWGAGSLGITQTTIVSNGATTVRDVYKTGNFVITYTSSVPYAIGETGTPVSTFSRPPRVTSYEVTSWYPYSIPEPTCGPSSWTVCSWSKDCNKCTISGGTVQLLYFPTTGTRPGLQSTPTISIPPLITNAPDTGVETATFGDYVLTSPSIYISFQTAYAQDDCGNQVGKRYPGAILPMKPGELSSVYGGYGTMWSSDPNIPNFSTPYLIAGSFNLADLNWPYPITAYKNQLKYALGREVFSIVTSPYNPVLAVPPEIRNLDPAWASCALDWEGLYDPPIALTKTDVVAGPTTPNAPIQTTIPPDSSFRPIALGPTSAIAQPTAPKIPVALQPTTAIQLPTRPPYAEPSEGSSPDPEVGADPGVQQPGSSEAPSHDSSGILPPNVNPGSGNDNSPAPAQPVQAGPGPSNSGGSVGLPGPDHDSLGSISPSTDPGRGSGNSASSGQINQSGSSPPDPEEVGTEADAGPPKTGPSVPAQSAEQSAGQQGADPMRATISAVSNAMVIMDVHRTTTIVLDSPSAYATITVGSSMITASRVPGASGEVDVVNGNTISAGGSAIVVVDDSKISSRTTSGSDLVSGSPATRTPAAATGDARGNQRDMWAVGFACMFMVLSVTL